MTIKLLSNQKVEQKSSIVFLSLAIAFSTLILFLASSVRHALFQSNFDLAIFDNAIYLISQGQTPFVVFRNLHILGDHAAWIVYPLALFYKIYPDVHWLFLIQALSLALAVLPLWYLSSASGLSLAQSKTVAIATQLIIPTFSGTEAAAVDRYSYLGDSVLDIVKNLVVKPNLVLGRIFSGSTLGYLILLFIPSGSRSRRSNDYQRYCASSYSSKFIRVDHSQLKI
jgi:uncharacterized membrane protein